MGRYTEKTSITKPEYQQLVGLLLLAQRKNAELRAIVEAASAIVGESPPDSLAADECYSNSPDADSLLRRSGIVVEP